MTKKSKIIASVVLSVLFLAVAIVVFFNADTAKSSNGGFSLNYFTSDGSNSLTATSAPTYLTTTSATTTLLTIYTGRADEVALNMRFTASSSGTGLVLVCEYSDGNGARPGESGALLANFEWYKGDCFGRDDRQYTSTVTGVPSASSTDSNITNSFINSATSTTVWLHGGIAGAPEFRRMLLPPITSAWMRIRASVVNTDGAIWMYATVKEPVN